MSEVTTLKRIEKEVETLRPEEQLRLVDRLIHRLMIQKFGMRKTVNLNEFYGIGKGLWEGEDAQEYVNKLREDRV